MSRTPGRLLLPAAARILRCGGGQEEHLQEEEDKETAKDNKDKEKDEDKNKERRAPRAGPTCECWEWWRCGRR